MRWTDIQGTEISKNQEYTFTMGKSDVEYVAEFTAYHNTMITVPTDPGLSVKMTISLGANPEN